ncbi:MAG: sensor histidine kinase, partial [Bacteroidia bacterium]
MNIDELSKEFEELNKASIKFKQDLLASNESIAAIKTGDIDALVVKNKNELKLYTETTAYKIYRILIEKMNEGAVTLNKTGIILYCNVCFANMVNTPLQKVIGAELKKFIADSSRQKFDFLLKQGVEKNIKEELDLHSTDGEMTPVLMSLNPFTVDNNFILSAVITDLTIPNKNLEKLKKRTAQLAKKTEELSIANIDLESFNYISSHDLQEPLRKIQNFVSLIIKEEKKSLSPTSQKYFISMQETAKRMQMLIDDLLIYSRAKNTPRKFEKIDLNTIIQEVKKDYEINVKELHADIVVKNSCKINVIRFQFFQLFHNLFSNSFKFTKYQHAPHITIRCKMGKGNTFKNEKLLPNLNYCHISFTDKGIGFDPQYEDRIFEVFQRLNNVDDYTGTGIGLAICKRIVEN